MSPQVNQPGSDAMFEATNVLVGDLEPLAVSGMDLLNSYAIILIVAFAVSLLVTPLVRLIALHANVTDQPDGVRKSHRYPVAYLGGIAVFLGLIVAIAASYLFLDGVAAGFRAVPLAVVLGMVAITFTGLADDLWGWDPRLKIAGQLVAAAALAIQDVGTSVAGGILQPLATMMGREDLVFQIPLPGGDVSIDLIYWAGTAIIAVFVLGGCNAANLLDGLDGLLSGVVAVMVVGLLCISLLMATVGEGSPDESLAGARMVLCFALLGAVLGFLPHNFNPASIFLGDCGSHLLGYVCVVIILMFGEYGQTHLVFAGLIIFSVPIIDTTLAIIRRWLAGRPMSVGDDQHVHHQLKHALGGVKRAVFAMYGITAVFAVVGVTLAALVMLTQLRVRVIYAIALILFGFIGVIAVKTARRVRQQSVRTDHHAVAGPVASAPLPKGRVARSSESAAGGRDRP